MSRSRTFLPKSERWVRISIVYGDDDLTKNSKISTIDKSNGINFPTDIQKNKNIFALLHDSVNRYLLSF